MLPVIQICLTILTQVTTPIYVPYPTNHTGYFSLHSHLSYFPGFSRFSEDIYTMLGRRLNIYWKACWLVLSPLVIGITITFNMIYYKPPSMDGLPYPAWAQTLSWLITFFPMAIIAAYFLFEYCRRGGFVVSQGQLKNCKRIIKHVKMASAKTMAIYLPKHAQKR